jgi:hypothetical protein
MGSSNDYAFETDHGQRPRSWLLRLPAAALATVLQKLDACNVARTSATCTSLRHAVPANISKLKVHCTNQETLDSLVLWLGHNSTSLTHLTQ